MESRKERLRRCKVEVTALLRTARGERGRTDPQLDAGGCRWRWVRVPWHAPGLSAQNPEGTSEGQGGTLDHPGRPGSGVWEPWCVGCLDPRVGKEAGSEKEEVEAVVQ